VKGVVRGPGRKQGARPNPILQIQVRGDDPELTEIKDFSEKHGFHLPTVMRNLLKEWRQKMGEKLEDPAPQGK
jgi:hypothetical protein